MDEKMIASSDVKVSESNFISKVYLWMSLGLGLSASAALWLLSQPALLKAIFTRSLILIGIVVVEFALVIWLSGAAMKMSKAMASLAFCGYSFLNGITLTSIFMVYTGSSILTTFAIAAGTFLFFSLYGLTTKKDLTAIASLAMMALFGIIIASVVNIFLKSSGLMWVTTFIGVAVFLVLIAWDTQKLKNLHAMGFENADMRSKGAILGALALYLDFINLFLMLLRIFGRQRD